ncbi:MAG TPA: HPr family phosphocarrier protein [Bacillales bacterium]|nr:HPr family phosphocarrier protein [Bacillales bacterium]
MLEKKVVVRLKSGLQARPAALFVQEANRYNADIFLEKNGKKVNAKSIMGIMSLAIGADVEVKLTADGNDEEKAMKALSAFVEQEDL